MQTRQCMKINKVLFLEQQQIIVNFMQATSLAAFINTDWTDAILKTFQVQGKLPLDPDISKGLSTGGTGLSLYLAMVSLQKDHCYPSSA